MGMSCDNDRLFPVGSLAIVKRGKYAGSACVVVGIDPRDSRILIANGRTISARHPKRKNIRHLQRTNHVFDEARERLARGEILDDGWLADLLRTRGDYDKITTCT